MAEAHAMVSLVEQGWADQNDVARAFGCSARTLRRDQRRYEEGGLAALGQPRRLSRRTSTLRRVRGGKRCIGSRRKGIRIARSRGGLASVRPQFASCSFAWDWKEHHRSARLARPRKRRRTRTQNCPLFALPPSQLPASHDTDPSDRSADRLLARLGLLQDAPPLFGSARAVPRAGVLLALPVLIASGVFECAQKIYGNLGPSFYGLRTSLLTLLLMALWRIKRPENLKEYSPQSLGRVLGLDRAPEVKTLRRKLASLAATGRAAQFGDALARRRVELRGKAMGFLYVDGHVRVYHGQHALPKAHVARMRISMPATSDYWVNDSSGDPLFVVTAEANAGLVKMLPGILDQVRGLAGKRRVTVVFDRGGFSPKLFQQIIAAGFDLLTYRKGRYPRIPRSRFNPHTARCGRTQGLLCSGRPGSPAAQRQTAFATGHAPDGQRTSDADPDLTARSGCGTRGVSNV